jgi:hypothetical protein
MLSRICVYAVVYTYVSFCVVLSLSLIVRLNWWSSKEGNLVRHYVKVVFDMFRWVCSVCFVGYFFDAPHMRREHHTVQLGTQARGSRCWTKSFCLLLLLPLFLLLLHLLPHVLLYLHLLHVHLYPHICFFIFILICLLVFFLIFIFFEIKVLSLGLASSREGSRPGSLHFPLERLWYVCFVSMFL